ncbi:3-oxoacyl-[acyl-carrier protein] reductase [Streptomyces zhaozhouensis]|uniref:3-oxoacyl-[acyl-carrier protein] reductase n=1 Tax=Streptomyces zhaozhouensis TaxID=1300267 RepID=A0A286DZD3_9ACTN|nr:3-oxoacyl-ACP reductase [Streptomyces zhaozhouensis]SOD64016.1 3-oxoacyl-[acyl-carrier protein] reductase [Streptomyces zhaozhouensis]
MADRYLAFATGRVGARVVRRLGLPRPVALPRHRPGAPVAAGPVVLGRAEGGHAEKALRAVLESCDARVEEDSDRPAALVYDATGIASAAQLDQLRAFFQPRVRALATGGRVVVVGAAPEDAATVGEAAARRALDGFVRSLGKELRGGATAQLVLLAPGAERAESLESTLRFLLSARSAYVSGQTVRLAAHDPGAHPADWERPLAGRTALVTGAARGIGAAIAETLARDGARVLALDTPGQLEPLRALAARLGGAAVPLDITASDAGARLRERCAEQTGGAPDIVVHNAGITRDRTLGRMDADRWRSVLDVNLIAVERLTDALLPDLGAGARIVCTSSISGLAGNVGQTNYAASKAGLVGLVGALAPRVAERGITVNAVAPGFIETRMTAAVPAFVRQAGRRMNSLSQGGLPVDVAEAVSYLSAPASGAVNGQVLRVCGQALLGA